MKTKITKTDGTQKGGLFSISRAIELSDGKMSYIHDNKKYNVQIVEEFNRTVQSHNANKDGLQNVGNLVASEKARLPDTADTLDISFSCKILGITETPSAIDKFHMPYSKNIQILKASTNPIVNNAFHSLAASYAFMIASGKWGWRNYDVSSDVSVEITFNDKKLILPSVKNAGAFGKLDDTKNLVLSEVFHGIENYTEFIDAIESTLRSTNDVLTLSVSGLFVVGSGARVYPSQLFLPDFRKKSAGGKNKFSTELFRSITFGSEDAAGISPEKILNKIRTIDLYHGHIAGAAISVEPNGASIQFGDFLRNSKNDFYKYNNLWMTKDFDSFLDVFAENPNDLIFFIAVLVRGGVLADSSKSST